MHFFSLLNLQMAISAPPSSSRSPATTAHRHRQHTQWRHHLLILVAIFNLIQCISATPVFSYNPSFSNCKYQSNSFAIKNQNIHLFRKLWSNWDKTIRPCCPIIDSQIYSWFAVVRVCVPHTIKCMIDLENITSTLSIQIFHAQYVFVYMMHTWIQMNDAVLSSNCRCQISDNDATERACARRDSFDVYHSIYWILSVVVVTWTLNTHT